MSAGKVTIVHCLSHLRRQLGWARSSRTDAISWARHGKRPTERRTHAQARSYTSVHAGGQTNTHKGTKRETVVSGNGLGNAATTISNHLSMAYLLSNICTNNYWNRTTIVEITVGGWMVSFFEKQCSLILHFPFMFFCIGRQ